MRKELFSNLTEEQFKKVQACKNHEELLDLAKQEGVELNDEQLEAIAGGWCTGTPPRCPFCGSDNTSKGREDSGYSWYCNECHSPYW